MHFDSGTLFEGKFYGIVHGNVPLTLQPYNTPSLDKEIFVVVVIVRKRDGGKFTHTDTTGLERNTINKHAKSVN